MISLQSIRNGGLGTSVSHRLANSHLQCLSRLLSFDNDLEGASDNISWQRLPSSLSPAVLAHVTCSKYTADTCAHRNIHTTRHFSFVGNRILANLGSYIFSKYIGYTNFVNIAKTSTRKCRPIIIINPKRVCTTFVTAGYVHYALTVAAR